MRKRRRDPSRSLPPRSPASRCPGEHVVDQPSDELSVVGRCGTSSERSFETRLGLERDAPRKLAREVDAAVRAHQVPYMFGFGHRARRSGPAEIGHEMLPISAAHDTEQMDEHECALALEEITENLLAIAHLVAAKIEEVVLDLERRTEMEPEADERLERDRAPRSDQCTDPERMHRR